MCQSEESSLRTMVIAFELVDNFITSIHDVTIRCNCTLYLKVQGRVESMVKMSFEKRFSILPRGVVSKKDIGDLMML